jgi:hypothetical protein
VAAPNVPATPFQPRTDGLEVRCRVQPNASRDRIDGMGDEGPGAGRICICLRAAPRDGAANRALEALVAKALGVPKSSVSVVAGLKDRNKTVFIAGAPAELAARAASLLGDLP